MTPTEARDKALTYMLRAPENVRKSYWYVVLFDGDEPTGYAHSAWNKQSAVAAAQQCIQDMPNGNGFVLHGREILGR